MPAIAMLLLLLGSFQSTGPETQTLRGTVRDQTGAVLQGAHVELATETGPVVRGVVTDARGEYRIEGIAPGAIFRPSHLRPAPAPGAALRRASFLTVPIGQAVTC